MHCGWRTSWSRLSASCHATFNLQITSLSTFSFSSLDHEKSAAPSSCHGKIGRASITLSVSICLPTGANCFPLLLLPSPQTSQEDGKVHYFFGGGWKAFPGYGENFCIFSNVSSSAVLPYLKLSPSASCGHFLHSQSYNYLFPSIYTVRPPPSDSETQINTEARE